MQLGHLPLALSIATYDWSPETALFCVAMHWLPNVDSLVVKAGWDKACIKGAIKFESMVKGKKPTQSLSKAIREPFWTENGGFHCTITHSILFALFVSSIIALFSVHYGVFAFVAIMAHFAADIGSTVGLPILWPFTRKKYTLALFKDTGWWGKDMLLGFYRQPVPWILEGGVILFLVYRITLIS
jgi:hypothetical protein